MADEIKKTYSHYHKDVSGYESIDVYRVLKLWEVTDPCVQHAIKKLLVAGGRGAKDLEKDLKEAIVSIQCALNMMQEDRHIMAKEIVEVMQGHIEIKHDRDQYFTCTLQVKDNLDKGDKYND